MRESQLCNSGRGRLIDTRGRNGGTEVVAVPVVGVAVRVVVLQVGANIPEGGVAMDLVAGSSDIECDPASPDRRVTVHFVLIDVVAV